MASASAPIESGNPTTTLPTSDWSYLEPDQLRALHSRLVRESAARLNVIAELEQALDACQRFPEAKTAGAALRLSTLMAICGHAA